MKAIEVTRYGGPDVLAVVEQDMPTPGAGQVLIKTRAAGVNFADLMSRAGTYPPAPKPPFVPGFEAAGTVESVGIGVSHLKVGDRVAALTQNGYAEYAIADAARAVAIPDALDFAQASALLVQGATAHLLLSQAVPTVTVKIVLVSAAAGGVGSLAVQIASLLGAETVIGLASTPEKRQQVKELGANFAVDYTQDGWAEEVKRITDGAGADIFLDATGDTGSGGLKPLAKGGHWVIYGAQSVNGTGLSMADLGGLIFNGQAVRGYSLYEAPPDVLGKTLHELFGWAAQGKLTLLTSDRFPLADAARAHEAIAARKTTGKVVLEP